MRWRPSLYITVDDILGKSREKRVSFPRQIVMHIMREELKMSYPAIGGELGGRDHTTAMHAHSKIVKALEEDLVRETKCGYDQTATVFRGCAVICGSIVPKPCGITKYFIHSRLHLYTLISTSTNSHTCYPACIHSTIPN